MPDPFVLPVEIVVAIVSGTLTALGIFIKGWADRSSKRLDEVQADLGAIKRMFAPVLDWALALEKHIADGAPPPPPCRPPELAEFFTAAFIDQKHSSSREFFTHTPAPKETP